MASNSNMFSAMSNHRRRGTILCSQLKTGNNWGRRPKSVTYLSVYLSVHLPYILAPKPQNQCSSNLVWSYQIDRKYLPSNQNFSGFKGQGHRRRFTSVTHSTLGWTLLALGKILIRLLPKLFQQFYLYLMWIYIRMWRCICCNWKFCKSEAKVTGDDLPTWSLCVRTQLSGCLSIGCML